MHLTVLSPADSPPRQISLILLSAISVVSLNMHIPSLTAMSADFGVSYADVSLSISLYMFLTAFLQIVVGPLSDRYGRRPVLLAAVTVFLAASAGCAIAEDFWVFMGFRFVQGAIATAAVISRAVVRDSAAPQDAAVRLGEIGMAMALAPMLAPMLGGLLESGFGWRSNFWTFALAGAALCLLSWKDVGETNASRHGSFGEQLKGYPELAADTGFWSYTLCMAFSVGVFFVYITGIPLVATEYFGMSPVGVGVVMGLPPVGFMLGNWIVIRMGQKVPLSLLMMTGRLVTLIALLIAALLLSLGRADALSFFPWMISIGIGNGLTIPSANAGVMSVNPKLAGTASGLSGAITILMGAGAAAATGLALDAIPRPATLLSILIGFSGVALVLAYTAKAAEKRVSNTI